MRFGQAMTQTDLNNSHKPLMNGLFIIRKKKKKKKKKKKNNNNNNGVPTVAICLRRTTKQVSK